MKKLAFVLMAIATLCLTSCGTRTSKVPADAEVVVDTAAVDSVVVDTVAVDSTVNE